MTIIDSRGTLCPQPIIDLARSVKRAVPGETITLLSDDLATWPDLQAWSRMTSHAVKRIDQFTFEIIISG